MSEHIETRLREWLSKSGFPLEMRVATAMRSQGVEVRQGDHYSDPHQPLIRREIDVVVSTRAVANHDALVEVAVECKASPDTPWVVFTKPWPRGFDGWPGNAALMSDKARAVKWGHANLMAASARVAYAVRPGFHERGKKDAAYEAVMQAVSYGEFVTGSSFRLSDGQRPSRRVVMPCVVFDGDLFEAFLGPEGSLQVQRITHAALECRQAASPVGFAAGVVVAATNLNEFASSAVTWIKDVAARLAYNP